MKLAAYFTRRVRLALYTLLTVFASVGLFGFLALPGIVKPRIEQAASEALQRSVSIGKVEINPYLYRLTLRDVAVAEKDGPLLRFAALTVDAELASLWRGGPVLREITLDSPELHIVRLAADRYNFSDLLDKKPGAPEQDGAPLPRFSLNNIRILNGHIDFDDQVEHTRQQISELGLTLPFISTLPQRVDEYIEPGLSGKLNGTPFRLNGQSKPFQESHETRLSLALDKLDLPHYLTYVPLPKDVTLPGGKLSGQMDIVFRTEKDQATLLLEGKLALHEGQLNFRGETILNLPEVQVEMKNLAPLAQKYHFSHIGLTRPSVFVARAANGKLNWLTAFASEQTSTKPATPATSSSPEVSIASLTLDEGKVNWQDASVKPGYSVNVEAINLKAQQLSTTAKTAAPLSLSFKTQHGETFKADAHVLATPISAEGRIELENIQPGHHTPYLKPFFAGEISSGQLATALNFRVSADPLSLLLSEGQFGAKNLVVKQGNEKQPAVKLAALNASGIGLDLGKKQLELANLEAKGAEVFVIHNKDDSINLLKLAPTSAKEAPAKTTGKDTPWRVKVAQLALENNSLRLEDRHQEKNPPLVLSAIDLRAQNLDTSPNSPAQLTLAARSGKRGQIRVSGPFVPQPFSAKWQLDIKDFDAAFAQSYLSQHLNIQLASLWLNAKGETQIATAPKTTARYRGNLALNNVLAIDKVNGANFLRWRNLALNGVSAQSEPARFDLNEIVLSDFYSRLILSKDGRLNLQDIVVRNGQTTSITSGETVSAPVVAQTTPVASQDSAPLPPIRIGKIRLAKGNINYTDNFIQPNFTANLTDMGGEISGLSSKNDTRASVDLRGSVDRIAPVTVTGSLNPLAQPLFIDIQGAVKGYELTAASTYSAKYAGYGIEKGKLSMDVAYFIENGQLKASNKLFLDQLTLGDKVDSPDATKLPVKFALALLTDRHGQINLNLPIEGSLNDPQFRIGRVILKVIGNLLEKAVTSPFSALGSLFGGNEMAFSRVEFEPGRVALGDEAKQSLAKLAQALNDRPALKLEMAGWADPAIDREGLRRNKLNAKIRARKLAQFTDKGQSSEQEERAISAEEYPRLLAQVYSQEKFAKPRNLIGLAKALPAKEMETLIMANTPVSDDELTALALRRATVVKDALKAAGLDDARLFILKPRLDPQVEILKQDGGKPTRVQFVLK